MNARLRKSIHRKMSVSIPAAPKSSSEKSSISVNDSSDTIDSYYSSMPFFRIDYRFGIDLEELYCEANKTTTHNNVFYDFEKFKTHYNANQSEFQKYAQELNTSEHDHLIDDIDIYSQFLEQLPHTSFKYSHIETLLSMLRNAFIYIQSHINCNLVDIYCFYLRNIIIPQTIKWSSRIDADQKYSVINYFENTIDSAYKELINNNKKHITVEHVELYTTFSGVYLILSSILNTTIDSLVLYSLIGVKGHTGFISWNQFPFKLRVNHAFVCLQILLRFFPNNSMFYTTYGFSYKTFYKIRDILIDAREAMVYNEHTIERIVVDRYINKINQEVFVRDIPTPDPEIWIKSLSVGEHGIIQDAAQIFSSYRIPVTVERIYGYLGQFPDIDIIKSVVRMLSQLRFITLSRLAELVEDSICSAITAKSKSCIVPLGDLGGSTSIVRYLAAHSTKINNKPLLSIQEALEQTDEDVHLLFADDSCLSGTQSIHTVQELLGLREMKIHYTRHAEPLPKQFRKTLLYRKCTFCFAVGMDSGVKYLNDQLKVLGFKDYAIKASQAELYDQRPFANNSTWLWRSRSELEKCRRFFRKVGYQILTQRAANKSWTKKRQIESSLGFSDYQRLLVYEYNVPKTTLTALWERGNVDGKPWVPLFPVTD